MKKIQFLILLFTIVTTAQNKSSLGKVEQFIVYKNRDSAKVYLDKLEKSDYKTTLKNIINKNNDSYRDYIEFITSISSKRIISINDLTSFLSDIPEPKASKIDLDYVELKWLLMSKIRDEATNINTANTYYENLIKYINTFNSSGNAVKKAKLYASTHKIVLEQIEGRHLEALELSKENYEIAKALNDKKMMIMFLYHNCDSYVKMGKLNEYINDSEQSLKLEQELEKKSPYYKSTIIHLLDAYIYKGEKGKKVEDLLNNLYNSEITKLDSYSLYAKYLSKLESNSEEKKKIFEKFNVKNTLEFANKVIKGSENKLNPNDFYYVLWESSNALQKDGFLKEALHIMDKAVAVTRNVYSKELSESLVNFETKQAILEKETEIKLEKEKAKTFRLVAILIGISTLLLSYLLFQNRKKSKILDKNNAVIQDQLEEKELLVKEIHHRVKNNFQMVSSLLELQTKGIEDEKAKALANEGQHRIKSMALIHQKLYQNETGLINFDEYLVLLVKELNQLYTTKNETEVTINSTNMNFDVDTAIPLGLIINELITNAYKYAFRGLTDNKLDISLEKEDDDFYKLTVTDNGKGLDKNIDIAKAKSLGLRLVKRLSRQLQGEFNYAFNNGATFQILFKDIHARSLTE